MRKALADEINTLDSTTRTFVANTAEPSSHSQPSQQQLMATTTISASALASTITRTAATALPKTAPVLGLPQICARGGRVRCSASTTRGGGAAGASLLGAAGMMSVSGPALALVDERMSTEGTGLSLGVSDNLLGWILLGVFGLIWALYFVYTSGLEEDEESGLSL